MSNRAKITVAFAAVYLIWGSTYLAIGRVVADVPPIFMVAVRGMLAGGVLYFWARRRGAAPITGCEMIAMLPTAALLFGGGYVLVGWAEQQVPSGPAALLNATTPAWVVLNEWLAGRRARPGMRFAGTLCLGICGVAVLVGAPSGERTPPLAALALVGSSVAWAAGTVRTRMQAHGDPVRDAALQLLTGGMLMLPFSALGEKARILDGFDMSSLLALAYLVVIGSVLAYSAYVFLLHNVAASKVASHSYVNPLIAVLVGAALAHESLTIGTAIAAACILLSVFSIVRERAPKARVPESAPLSPRPRIAA